MTIWDVSDVCFITVPTHPVDRGWSPDSVRESLDRIGIQHRTELVRTSEELAHLIRSSPDTLWWPLAYTIEPNPAGPYIVEFLHTAAKWYLGLPPSGIALTSKLRLKEALSQFNLPTPPWQLYQGAYPDDWEGNRAFLKTEFSCDSYGVRHISSDNLQTVHVEHLQAFDDDRVFWERDLGRNEWTVGVISDRHGVEVAPMPIRAADGGYIDSHAKHHNLALRFPAPDIDTSQALASYVRKLVGLLELEGYFRLDVIAADHGELFAIDMNCLPCLNADPAELSYFPMSFMRCHSWAFDDLVVRLITSGMARRNTARELLCEPIGGNECL